MSVTFTNRAAAEKFARFFAAKGAMAGSAFWNDEKIIALANNYAKQLGEQRSAQAIVSLKIKGKAVKIVGCQCRVCGTLLTAPDSVAAGIGPECMAK